MSTIDRLAGRRVLEEVVSEVNGTITVVKEFLWGTYIMAGGLPQSGGLAERIWRKPLARVKRSTDARAKADKQEGKRVKTILILGFGGGGMVPVIRKHWPEAKITGVDIDPIMVDFGKKYLDWDEKNIEIHIVDATEYVDNIFSKNKTHHLSPVTYDLICVDMYVGQGVPGKFNTTQFAKKVKGLLTKDGIAIFNRLYGGGNKEAARQFEEKLKKVYKNIDTVRPEANIMFLCSH